MQKSICISAVIPTYNREQTIARAIDSVLTQEFPASELIIIDDGSTDNTRRIVEDYGEKVRYLYQANAGVSSARNRGVHEAKCEWIAFLDSDDYWLPHHLGHMVEAIEATEGKAALYFCDLQRPADEGGGRHWDLCGFRINGPFEFRQDAGEWALMRVQPMVILTSVIRRASYLEIGGLPADLRTREDTLLFFKLGLLYAACAVSNCGAHQTSDSNMRLTRELGSASLPYWFATVSVCKSVLAIGNAISPERREFFMGMLSAAYYSIGRIFFRQKRYLNSIRNLFISGLISPSKFPKDVLTSLGNLIRRKREKYDPIWP